jgi:hypothetical protein
MVLHPELANRVEVARSPHDLAGASADSIYGLFFTSSLASPSHPASSRYAQLGRASEGASPLLAPLTMSSSDRVQERKSFDEFLQTKLSALASVKPESRSSPLTGSFTALLLDLPT